VLLLLWAGPAASQEIDPFYTRLLDDGIRAAERGDHVRASEELRIAAFGLMEAPARLSRALTHLALAQSTTANAEGLTRTLRRLTELETQFGAYSAAELTPATRAALDEAARNQLSADELLASPLLVAAPAPVAVATEGEASQPARVEAQATLCISWTPGGDCRQPGTPLPEAAPTSSSDAQPMHGPSPEELASVDRLSRLAASKGSPKKLRRGFEEIGPIADLYPDWAEAQRAAGLLAARSESYAEAVAYFRRSGTPAEDQPVELFYLSVALFETDEPEEAAETLRRALPELQQNREVRRYVRRILPSEAQS
jgi:tetratricopeptide (TPR) repeat protein